MMKVVLLFLVLIAIASSRYANRKRYWKAMFALRQTTDMEKMRHQWGITFDSLDMNKNGILEKSDLDQIKSNAANFISAEDLAEKTKDQDEFWKAVLQIKSLNTVCTLDQFLSVMENMYTNDKPGLTRFWKTMSMMSISIFIDSNDDGQISKAEIDNAAYDFGDSGSAAEKLLPLTVAELVAMSVKFNTIPGEDAEEKIIENVVEG